MFKNISLSLSGFVFLIVIAAVYLRKKKYQSAENNIYRLLIFWTIGLLILEISCNIIISYRFQLPLLTEMLCRAYIFADALWFIFLIAYMEAFLTPEKYKNASDVFSQKYMIIFLIISFIMFIISCFLNLTYISPNGEYNVIGGDALFVLYVVFFTASVLIAKVLLKNMSRTVFMKRLPMLLYLVLFGIMKVFQYFYSDLSDLGFLFAFAIVAMYFTIENQDIKLVSELDIAKEKAETSDKSKTEFLAKMSHDIRTPMNVIMGYSENLMEKDVLDKNETIEDVKNIQSAGRILLEIINNVLLFSRIESGKEQVEEIEYDFSDLIDELNEFVSQEMKDKNIEFKINISDNFPKKYVGDKQKLYKILINIISNSIKFTTSGSIEFNASCHIIDDNIGKLKIEIIDTGIGMTEEQLEVLSKELNSTDETRLDTQNLGLLVVKKLLNMLNAELTFSSEYGSGSIFAVVINQKIVGEEKLSLEEKVVNDDINYFDLNGKKILIVDDNDLNRKVAQKLLKPYKCDVKQLSTGFECIKEIREGMHYDLIFLDHLMPEMDGIETLRTLKKQEIKLPPIIVLTANTSKELKKQYTEEGFDGYLAKPINPTKLYKVLYKFFKKRGRV